MQNGTGRRNKNRGYQQLRVWQDAIDLYRGASEVFSGFPFVLRKVASQNISSVDSVHRNLAEGYCRRSIREYIQFLYIALGSLGESVSGFTACRMAEQICEADFERLDSLAYRLEYGLLNLVASLEAKQASGDWIDSIIIRESNMEYTVESENHEDLYPLESTN
jgi:four helix bundle protein